jgi:chemotaxis protein MotB
MGLNDNVAGADFESMSEEEKGEVLKVRGDILTRLKAAFEDAGIEVNIDDTTGEIIMDAKVLFDVDSYEISDEGKKYLDQFVKVYVPVLFSNEFKDSIDQVHFDGHTDSRGSFGHNAELSDKRARAVLDYCLESTANGLTAEEKELLSQKGVTQGHASTNLIYDEEGHEDSEASRRVTVKFFIKVN